MLKMVHFIPKYLTLAAVRALSGLAAETEHELPMDSTENSLGPAPADSKAVNPGDEVDGYDED